MSEPKPGTYGAITRSAEVWNWRAAARRASFSIEDLIKVVEEYNEFVKRNPNGTLTRRDSE